VNEVARLTGRCYRTIWNNIKAGKIRAVKEGRFLAIPREEALRLMGHIDDKTQFDYYGIRLPHEPYLLSVMIETLFDMKEVAAKCKMFRLPPPDPNIFFALKDAIISSAPKNIKAKLLAGRPIKNCHHLNDWYERLGIRPLFDNIAFPCLNILHDHSAKRIDLEILLTGSVSIVEITNHFIQEHKTIYTQEQLLFFQSYFYNLTDLTFQDFRRYLGYLDDLSEQNRKLRSWG
jgi:hypothetical protein